MSKKLTQDEFLIKATKENRNNIDYSDFIYNGDKIEPTADNLKF